MMGSRSAPWSRRSRDVGRAGDPGADRLDRGAAARTSAGRVLHDVRGVFFALVVSVAVVVAGVAPLVQADADERRLIVFWTLAVCGAAGIVYTCGPRNRSEARTTCVRPART